MSEAHVPERVSVVSGDRACGSCGFNLHGQNVVREPHYAMLMVRCPECGQVASLHEYPVLGPWAKRLGFVLAAGWLLAMLAAVVATTGALMGGSLISSRAVLSGVASEIAGEQIGFAKQKIEAIDTDIAALGSSKGALTPGAAWRRLIDDAAQASQAKQQVTAAQLTRDRQSWTWIAQQNPREDAWVEEAWWASVRAGRDYAKGLWSSIDVREVVWTSIAAALMPAIAGVFWSVSSPRWRGRSLLIAWFVLSVVGAGALVVAVVAHLSRNELQSWGAIRVVQASGLAEDVVGYGPLVTCFCVMSGVLLVAMRFGRAWARLAVRALLPPRQRVAVSYLWLCDGLDMPRRKRSV